MQQRELSKIFFAAMAAMAMACNSSDAPAPQLPPPSTGPAAEPAQAPADEANKAEPTKPASGELEQSAVAGTEAPFVLTLDAPEKVPGLGIFKLGARIEAGTAVNAPTTITIELPASAKLKSGQQREQLASLPGGTTNRTFEIVLSEQLSDATPVKVVVDIKDPKGTFGAHAERLYPEKPQTKNTAPSRVPKPPVGRPGQGAQTPGGAP